ncbi:unnamed protein product [Calicophoron daubneyi]|uniref:Uncharacterized protein n=1 Tax=Calicophoron daubneyi TaxID=300641 RepID=A0AAV2T032_CALDB
MTDDEGSESSPVQASPAEFDVELENGERFTPPRDDALLVLAGHKESVFCVSIDPSATYLASGGQDHIAIVWDLQSGDQLFVAEGHEDSVTCVEFSPDSRFLASGDMAGGIRVWLRPGVDAMSKAWALLTAVRIGDLLWLKWWQPPESERKDPVKPSSAVLAAGDSDGLVGLWSISSNMSHEQEEDTSKRAKYIAGSGVGALSGVYYPPSIGTSRPKLVVLYQNAELRLWDLKSGDMLASVSLISRSDRQSEEPGTVYCLTCQRAVSSAKNKDLLLVGGDGVVLPAVFGQDDDSSYSAKCLAPIDTGDPGSVEAIDFAWTHPFFAFGTVNGAIGIVDMHRMRIRRRWIYVDQEGDSDSGVGLTSLRWSQTYPVLFTGHLNGAVVCWPGLSVSNEGDPSPLAVWWGHSAAVLDIALPPLDIHSRTMEQKVSQASAKMSTHSSSSYSSAGSKFMIEPIVASCSDDATVRLFCVNIDPSQT